MNNEMTQRWNQYRPTKTLWFWSCAGTAVLTMIIGFSAGGWVTGGTAAKQIETSSQQAVAQLAANICAKRFLSAPNAQAELTRLKEVDAWKQDSFIEEGGWVTFANMQEPIDGAADMCAEKVLAGGDAPPADAA